MFISILYVFRTAMCPSSGELIYQYNSWYMSLCVDDRLVCRFGWNLVSAKPLTIFAPNRIPLGLNKNTDKIPFHPYFTVKDILGFAVTIIALTVLTLKEPYILRDPDNFTPANPLVTPVHIQPGWYCLFVYAILRSISNKLSGVIALVIIRRINCISCINRTFGICNCV